VIEGEAVKNRQWKIEQGVLIDRDHSVFMNERAADVEKMREELGEDADAFAVAIQVMERHRDKYAKMSELRPLEPLPTLSVEDAGTIRLDVQLAGHSVVGLRLEPLK